MLLECQGITKRFGGLVALDDFDMSVDKGEITGLIGPNGAGKTTCFNVITGVYQPEEGDVRFQDEAIAGLKTHKITHAGIARTFQTPQPLRTLTVEENIKVARHFGRTDSKTADTGTGPELGEVLRLFDLTEKREMNSGNLQLVERKYLDLARAMVTNPKLILADEIMAGLNPSEKDEMNALIKRIRNEFDINFLIIEHDLRVIRAICDRVVVINKGRNLHSGLPDEVLEDKEVREAYVGA